LPSRIGTNPLIMGKEIFLIKYLKEKCRGKSKNASLREGTDAFRFEGGGGGKDAAQRQKGSVAPEKKRKTFPIKRKKMLPASSAGRRKKKKKQPTPSVVQGREMLADK